jgi:hypothetical protein
MTIIPIFGYTPEVQKQQITIDGETTTVELAMATTKHIIQLEATPSTWNLHKYLVIVSNNNKPSVMKEIQQIFRQIEGPLPNQPPNSPVPQCGGSKKFTLKNRITTTKKLTTRQPALTWSAWKLWWHLHTIPKIQVRPRIQNDTENLLRKQEYFKIPKRQASHCRTIKIMER